MPAARPHHRPWILFALVAFAASTGLAQVQSAVPRTAVTAADYARAEKFLAAAVNPLVVGGSVTVNRLPGERFWYRSVTPDGVTFYIVTPSAKSRVPAFDHGKLAAALATAAGAKIDPKQLPFQTIQPSADGASVSFDYDRRRWTCDVQGTACAASGDAAGADAAAGGRGGRGGGTARGAGAPPAVTSPDGKRAVFIRDWNLVVRDVATRQETALTKDGEKDFGYATDNAGWASSERAIVLWSPDSKKIATYQQDERKVGDMHLVETKAGHPVLRSWKYPLPGDENVAMMHRVDHRSRYGEGRPLPDAARLPPRDAWRQLQPERHAVEPRRVAAGLRVDVARPQAGGRPRGRRRHWRRSHGVRGDREDALRVARGLARALGDQARSSGRRSATTGASSISTISGPGR